MKKYKYKNVFYTNKWDNKTTTLPKHFEDAYNKYAEETAKQIAIDIDKDIIDRIMKMTPITFKKDGIIILRKRNYVPNNKVVI